MKTEAPKHTPAPWHIQPIGSRRYVEAQGPKFICDMQRDEFETAQDIAESDANAAHIVLCVNSHERLVKACEAVLNAFPPSQYRRKHLPPALESELRAVLTAAQPAPNHAPE